MTTDTIERTNQPSRPRSRRGVAGPILAGLGTVLLAAGLMVHYYAVPKLAVAPKNQSSITSLEAKNATVFDTSTLKPITTDLSIKNRTVGNAAATEKAPAHTLVCVSTTTITSSDGVVRSQSASSTAFNEKTAEAVNCCGNFSETTKGQRVAVTPKGKVFKFPFFAKKQTYQLWDDTLEQTVKTQYAGTSKIKGLTVYKYISNVPASVVGHENLPASVFGLPGTGNVAADAYYQNSLTQWVDPITGAIIDRSGTQKNWYAAQGKELVTTDANIAYTDGEVSKMVDEVKTKSTLLRLGASIVPWLVSLLGLLLIVGGVLTGRRRSA